MAMILIAWKRAFKQVFAYLYIAFEANALLVGVYIIAARASESLSARCGRTESSAQKYRRSGAREAAENVRFLATTHGFVRM